MTQNDMFYNIVAGPGKWDLLSAFGNSHLGQIVEFQYFNNSRMKIHLKTMINSLEHESGGGESWNFKGTAEMPNGRGEHIAGYYSTHSRNGHFKIVL